MRSGFEISNLKLRFSNSDKNMNERLTATRAAATTQQSQARQPEPLSRVAVERNLEVLSRLMDSQFAIPGLGWRFGLDSIVGLIPGLGDAGTSLVSLYILASAVRYRVPKITLLRMGFNIGLDWAVGSLPLVGDLFDAWWKSNSMNIELIRRRAAVSADEARKGRLSDWLFVAVIMLALIAILIGSLIFAYFIIAWLWSQLRAI